MKYRLKDAELQAKLDEISGGDFSELLGGVEDTGFSALRIPLCGFIEDAGQTIIASKYSQMPTKANPRD